ncbi:hypothetical protein ABTX60_08280 [Streptomyces sp. NPDC126510]|uniref:hypothetical protein n=1 Tax=Streptomyces sp. NPDC126510 TaxID=3155317 RepID=UPI00331908AE
MRLTDLSHQTDIPLKTLLLYQRLNLLPAVPEYTERHVRRAILVRTLIDVGGLSYAAARNLVRHMDGASPSVNELFGAIQRALPVAGSTTQDDQEWASAREQARALVETRRWKVSSTNPGWQPLTQALVVYKWLGQQAPQRLLEAYAESLESAVRAEVGHICRHDDPDSAVSELVVWTVLGDVVTSALRHLIHEHTLDSLDPQGHREASTPVEP